MGTKNTHVKSVKRNKGQEKYTVNIDMEKRELKQKISNY